MENMHSPNSNPQLKDLLDAWKKNVFIDMNCHALGTIESFDPDNQTASISINYLKSYVINGESVPKKYPLLLDCPIIMMSGGGATLTFPVKKGDTCLVLFNDRNIDNWFVGGQVTELDNNRAHSLSDGIALIGLRSVKNKVEDYDENRAVLRKGDFAMGVGDKVLITKNYPTATETLNTSLQDLINAISTLSLKVNSMPGGTNTVSAQVLAIGLDIGDLLE